MSLVEDRTGIKARTPMPVQDVTSSTKILAITGETVTFANGVAGTTQQLKLTYDGIMSATGDRIGQDGDTSIAWTTGTVLTTEVPWRYKNTQGKDNDTDRLAILANGEYMVDYENGYILGKNASTTSSSTDTIAYDIRTLSIDIPSSITVETTQAPSSATSDAYAVDQSSALESSSVSKASSGNVFKVGGRLNETLSTGTYYFQLYNATSVPSDGSVTFLKTPTKIKHITGTDSTFDLDATPGGLPASTGICWGISTTEFTKTEAGDFASVTLLYK